MRWSIISVYCVLLFSWGCGGQRGEIKKEDGATARLRETAAEREANRGALPGNVALRDDGARGAATTEVACFGWKINAARIVLVVDGSASMAEHYSRLSPELVKVIDCLGERTAFNVVFAKDGLPMALAGQWVMADGAGRAKAAGFLRQFRPAGESDAMATLQGAFSMHPEVIIFVSDGDFPGEGKLAEGVRRLNKADHVRIFTVHVGPVDERDGTSELMRKIAKENGGEWVNWR